MLKPFGCLVIATLLCNAAAADDWPQFRGPTGDGHSDASNVPIRWSSTENVKWKTAIPGSGWSSPILKSGRAYLTTATEDDKSASISLRAVCIDTGNGHIVWNVEVFRPSRSNAEQLHTKNSLASSTAVVEGDRLYVHFGHMGTAALDLQGNIVWRQDDVTYRPVHGNGGSPALVDDVIVFSCDAASDPFVAARDKTTGEVRWRTPRNTAARQKFSFSTPLVIELGGHRQIISAGSGFVGAYEPKSGREIWRVDYDQGYSVVPRPVFAHDLLFVSTGYNRARLLAIDPEAARGNATDDHVVWSHDRGAPLTPSMLVDGDELYFISDKGIASCLDARTGRVHWSERLPGAFSASPVFAEARIYFQNEEGVGYVVRASQEFGLLATNDLAERSLASPAVADGAIYLRTESHLWRIGE